MTFDLVSNEKEKMQLANARNLVFVSGAGLILLTTLYWFGFHEIGFRALGHHLFLYFCAFQFIIGALRLLLGAFRDKILKKLFLKYFYLLMSIGVISWACTGVYLFFVSHSAQVADPLAFDTLIKVQSVMMVGILSSVPQFFRHTKVLFLTNIISLYIGLLFLTSLVFQFNNLNLYASLIVTLFAIVITPQYLINWKTEAKVRTNEQRLQTIMDGFPGAVAQIVSGRYRRVNKIHKEQFFGMTSFNDEWIDRPLGNMHADKNFIDLVERFSASEKNHEAIECQILTPTGERFYLCALSRIEDNAIIVASLDIQKLVEMKREAEFQRHEIEEKTRLAGLGLMAGGIAHEINNPLAIILSRTERAIDILNKKDVAEIPKTIESLEKVLQMVKRISTIVSSMRNLTREAGRESKESFTPRILIEDFLFLIEEKLKIADVSLEFDGPALDSPIHANKSEISQVLMNSINNSIQAIKNHDQKWIKIMAVKNDTQCLKILIQDSGQGIPLEIRSKIMSPLFTLNHSGEGSGLGLALSKKIMENHHGKLYFDHDESHTTLVIEIPLPPAAIG